MKWQGYRSDVAGFAKGWFDILWDEKRKRFINLFGHSHNPVGDNSVRAFYPLTNTWEILYPSNGGTDGLQNRDNYVAWIVDDELFVTGGSTGQNFGIFNLVENVWKYVGTGESLMENFSTWGRSLGGHGYSAELQTFVTYYPVEGQPTVGWLHNLKKGTAKRFAHSAVKMPTAFGSRKETHNGGVVAGKYFYLYGGRPTQTLNDTKDFWRCDLETFVWTRLTDAPWAVYQPVLTHDSTNDCLVLHGGALAFVPSRNTALFDLRTETWTDVTAAMELFPDQGNRPHQNRLRAGCYAPAPVNRHFYTGGINRVDGGSDSWTLSRAVDGFHVGDGEVIDLPIPPSELTVSINTEGL